MRSGWMVVVGVAAVVMLGRVGMGAEYYVAPKGDDRGTGTIDRPWATVSRAEKVVEAGDTVYLRGGTYQVTEKWISDEERIWAYVFDMTKSGKEGRPIRYVNYRGERPVFDFSGVKPAGLRVIAFHVTGSWLEFKGFEVTGVQVTIKTHTQSECFENWGSHNVYEGLAMHDGMGIGWYLLDGLDNLVLNCDAYRNWDPVSEDGRGGNTDGFGCHPRKGAVNNVLRGCRAWFNSDDGYDCINSGEAVTFDHCWAFYNGFSTEFKSLGDGNGFKAGGYGHRPLEEVPSVVPHHVVKFCVAVGNKAHGFYLNHHMAGDEWLNDSAYRNGVDFDMVERVGDDINTPGVGQIIRNCLAYKGKEILGDIVRGKCVMENNSFDLKLKDSDFLSLEEKELRGARGKDGGLPEMRFLHPVKGSAVEGMGAFVKEKGGR